jgi:hypothetical protein
MYGSGLGTNLLENDAQDDRIISTAATHFFGLRRDFMVRQPGMYKVFSYKASPPVAQQPK